MKALQGSLSCAQLCSCHHSSTGHNTVGCLYWREDHELDCVLQTKGEPLSDSALPGCMKNRLCKLHNAPGCSQQCHGRLTGLVLGQGGSQISSLLLSLQAWESSGELLCSNPPPSLISWERAVLLWSNVWRRVVFMDQREPGMVARCSAELWGAPREGNRRDITLVLLVCIPHPCPSARAHLVHWDSAPRFWLVPVHYNRKLSKAQENTVNTKPVYTEDPISHSAWKRCSLTTQRGWCDTLSFPVVGWMNICARTKEGQEEKRSWGRGRGLLDCLRGTVKMQCEAEISKEHKIPTRTANGDIPSWCWVGKISPSANVTVISSVCDLPSFISLAWESICLECLLLHLLHLLLHCYWWHQGFRRQQGAFPNIGWV